MKLLVVDSNALLHRSFHALPPLATKNGEQTGAVYGFLLTLFKAINDLRPDYIAACFDLPAPTFRHKQYKEYKAKRMKTPDELVKQIPKIKEILNVFNVPVFEKEGFEADDLIATISKKAPGDIKVYILTGDLDTLQIISPNIKVYTLGRGMKETVIYDKERVIQRFGLLPEQLVDFKALAGDPSDNIPGADGIGKKTATELLKKYGNLENIYKRLESEPELFEVNSKTKSKRIREILLGNKEQVFFSYILAKVRENAPIDFDLKKCKFGDFDTKKIEKILEDFEFYSLIKRLPSVGIRGIDKQERTLEQDSGKDTSKTESCVRRLF